MTRKTEADDLLELLRQPFEYDPATTAVLVELTNELRPKEMESLIFRALDSLRSPLDRLNLATWIRGLVASSPNLALTLRNSTKPKGRCPAGARGVVVSALQLETSKAGAALPLSPGGSAVAGRRVEVDLFLNPETTTLYALPRLFDGLAEIEKCGGEATLRMKDFIYASGLAIVATWANARGAARRIVAEDRHTDAYLRRMGFLDAIHGIPTDFEGDPEDWSVRLTTLGDPSVEDATRKMLDILDTFVSPTREERASLGILLGETIENVHRHAGAKTPGFVVAQVYPKRLKLQITIADPGMGIRTSFLQGDVENYRRPDWTDSEFIRLAVQPLVTSKTAAHSGYGLYVLAELVRRNRGTYAITSGSHTVIGYLGVGGPAEEVRSHAPWQGTVVTMILDLHNKLPLGEVYKTLPLPDGMSEDDFFEQ